jgi:hypothetical protein
MKEKKDSSSSILYNQTTTTRTNTAPDAVSGHCYSEENLLSMLLSNFTKF